MKEMKGGLKTMRFNGVTCGSWCEETIWMLYANERVKSTCGRSPMGTAKQEKEFVWSH